MVAPNNRNDTVIPLAMITERFSKTNAIRSVYLLGYNPWGNYILFPDRKFSLG
jgi:hypothetical protein